MPGFGNVGHGIKHPWRLIVIGLCALLATGSALGTVAAELSPTSPSLAQGHAQVTAHGVTALPSGSVVWRAVSDPAKLPADAPTGSRALGFVLADQGAVLVTDDNGDQVRLAPGEATFVRDGQQQARASLGTDPAQYDAIELVAASDQHNIGAGNFLGASDPFTAPGGTHDLDLVRDVLKPNETSTLPDTGAPTMVLITAGTAKVTAGTTTNSQGKGGAAAYTGQVTVTATGSGDATFVAALIGPEIATSGGKNQTQATGGTLTITTRNCPNDSSITPSTSLDTLNAKCPVVSSGIDFKITFAPGAKTAPGAKLDHPLTIADAKPNSDGSFTWSNLPFATYRVEQTKLPADTTVFLVSKNLAVPGPFSVVIGSTGQPNTPANAPNQTLTLYDFPASAVPGGAGSIVVHVYACPDGMNPDNVDPSQCTNPAPAGYDFTLTPSHGTPLTVADAPGGVQGDGFQWVKLASGTYHFVQSTYGDGFDMYWVKPGDGISGSIDKGYDLTISPSAQTLNVYVYEFKNAVPNATGVIRVTTHLCQPGMDLSNFDASRCQVTQQGIDFSLTGQTLPRAYTLQDALDAGDGAFAWQQLPFGSYHIAQTQLPPGSTSYWIQTSAETGGGPDQGYDTAISAGSPARDLQVYDFSPGEQGGVSGPQPTAAPPVATAPPESTSPSTSGAQVGDLLIQTQDANGNALGGACYELQGSGGTIDICDNGGGDALSGDSRILLTQIPAGSYTLQNTQVPLGYGLAANQSVTVIANGAFPGGEAIITVTIPNGVG